MSEIDIIKGVNALKSMAQNIGAILDFAEANNLEHILSYIKEAQNGCSMLTNIFEKAFTDMIAEKERMEDDGK